MQRTVVISGANGSLGSVLVEKFLKNSDAVIGLFHSRPELEETKDFSTYTVNLLDENATNNMIAKIIVEKSHIDILVCTAGGFTMGNIQNTHSAELQKQYQMNFLTAYNLVQPVFVHMKQQGSGKIFLIGSQQGLHASKSASSLAYGLSKSLLFHLAEILNKEGEGKVVVSVIVPTIIDTAANRKAMPRADVSTWVTPDEIGDVILFYSSGAANSIQEPVIQMHK